MSRAWRNEERLRSAYQEHGEQKLVAEKFGCSIQTIQKWMGQFDIPVRKKHPSHPFYHEEKLRTLYEDHGSVERVREELGCSPNHLKKWMDHHGIERNWKHDGRGEKVETECSQCEKASQVYQSVRKQFEKWFCSRDCMGEWQSQNQVGKDSPSWKGGSIPYNGSWLRVRDRVRFRDENTCQKCGFGGGERIPDVHHIEPVRSFDDPHDAHFMENLVQLCRTCHNKVEKYSPEKQREILDPN